MPRLDLIRTSQFVYHVTGRANNKEWFYIPIRECWEIFEFCLTQSAERYKTEIHSFVLMSNHYHLLVSTPHLNLDMFMRHLLTEVSRAVQKQAFRKNHVFGTRYKWSVLETNVALACAFKYVYRNPVRAGLSLNVEGYEFSTLHSQLNGKLKIPLSEGFSNYWNLIPKNESDRLAWLNLPTPKEQEELVRMALRRKSFKFSRNKTHAKNIRLLTKSYGVDANLL